VGTLDQNLLARLSEGDKEAFRKLFERLYAGAVQRAVFYILDRQAAEDIAQDAFAHIWDNRRKINEITNIEAYLARWIRNSSLNHLKHSKVVNHHRHASLVSEASTEGTDPETYYRAIDELIRAMPQKRREVLSLSVYHSKSNAEIAEITGTSINTVKDHIKAAYAYLRQRSAHIPYP